MGQIVKLVECLADLDDEDTIYACEPWTEESDAMAAREQEGEPYGVPPEAGKAGMTYFLEIFTSREVVEDWIASLDEKPTLNATCQRLIEYAIKDA
jgi:hypothetical protein